MDLLSKYFLYLNQYIVWIDIDEVDFSVAFHGMLFLSSVLNTSIILSLLLLTIQQNTVNLLSM